MAVATTPHASDALADGTVDAVVIGGGAAGLNGALILARSRRSVVVIDSGSPRNAPAEAVHGFIVLDGTPPLEILRRGREQVRQYGGRVVHGEVVSAESAAPSADGDLRFTVTLADGRSITARRILVATGLTDVLPEVPGLAEHWGHSVVHCPYCHGWELRDEPIGILATGAASIGHAFLFRQLTEDLTYFTQGTDLDEDSRARFAARGIGIIDTPVTEVVNGEDGAFAGVRLADGQVVARRVLAVAAQLQARTEGLEGLSLPVQDLPNMGRGFASGMAGTTEVPGVWVAGNATDLVAQVGASAAAGALAGADINRMLATADTDAALSWIAEVAEKGPQDDLEALRSQPRPDADQPGADRVGLSTGDPAQHDEVMPTTEGTIMQTAPPVALVTGASSGIGRAAALALDNAGFAVVGTSRNAANAEPLAGVTFLDLDVASDESVRSLVEEVIERFGRIDVLVNNAGVGAVGAGEESSINQTKEVFDINVFGLIRMTNAVLPYMRAQGSGRVINVSSVLGLIPAPFMAIYAATKHAIEGYSESVDHELREHGVRMLLIEPAYTSTSFEASSLAPDSPLPIYAAQREVSRDVLATAVRNADAPDVVAKVIVAASTDSKPKLRYTAGSMAGRVSVLRRIVPSRAFDKQIRKLNRLAG